MKKSFVKLVSVSLAAATIATAVAPAVSNAQTITMPSGNVYTKDTNTGNMTKAEAAAAITELMAYYASETAKANDLQPKIEATQKDVTEAEATLTAKEKTQAEAQATFEAAQAAAGTTATDDRYINRDYDSVKKEIQDKYNAAVKEADKTRNARIQAAEDAVYEAQKVANSAQSDLNTARENLQAASGTTTREVTVQEEVVVTPAQPAVPAVTELQDVTRTETVPAADQATIDGYKAAVQEAETAVANANDALNKAKQNEASEISAANGAYNSAEKNAEAVRQQELRDAEFHFEKNDQYGEKSLKDAKAALDRAKSETSAAQKALQSARQALNGFQNQFRVHSANAELASYKAAEISLGKNIDVNKELGNVSADQIKVLEDLRAQGAEAIQQKADEAAKAKESAEKALEDLRAQNTDTTGEPNPVRPEDQTPADQAVALAVNAVYEGDAAVTGTSVAGAQINVAFPAATAEASFIKTVSAQAAGSAQAGANGAFSVAVPAGTALKAGQVITVTATANGQTATRQVTVQPKGAVAGARRGTQNRTGATLPETGENSSYAVFGAAALSVLAGLGLVAPKFRKED